MSQEACTLKYNNLFKDYALLAKSHETLKFNYMETKFQLTQLQKDMGECCSTADLQDRALAHKALGDAVDKLTILIHKFDTVERTHVLHAKEIDDLKIIKNELAKIKTYGTMVVGGAVALEFFGVVDKLKAVFI